MKRREFITLLGGAAAWPLAAHAQQPGKTPRVGYIRAGTPHNDPFREEFVRGMRDLGYVEGRNIAYEFRHYGDDVESIPSLIGDLLRAKVDIIVVGGTAAIRAAQSATQSIPIVMGAAADPLESGLIAGLARPGGNTTGLSVLSAELAVKRLEILKQVIPKAARIAILQQPANPAHSLFVKEVEPIAGVLGLTYRILQVRGLEDFEPSFASMRAWPADAVFVLDDATFIASRAAMAAAAARHRLPLICGVREMAEAGPKARHNSRGYEPATTVRKRLMSDLRRRQFITLLSGAAAWPLAARAQQAAMPVIGFLGPGSAQSDAPRATAFRQGLGEAGLVEGRNFTIEYRWADSHYDRLPSLAGELVRRQVAVLATSSTPAVLAAKAATTTIPIVFETASDPVKLGLVASLNRPGGNVTGVTQVSAEMTPKRLELLHELLPQAGSLALLVNPTAPELAEGQMREVRSAAQSLGIRLHVLNASTEQDFDKAFGMLTELRAGGLVIGGDAFFTRHLKQLAALTVQYAVPAIYQYREFAEAGGLMSYGSNIADTHRLVGLYAGRILKGANAADLPVQQATTKVEMYINLKTARALGITISLPLSGRADEIFE